MARKSGEKWYHDVVVVALALTCLLPLGLALLWSGKSPMPTKIGATVLFGGLWLYGALQF